MTFLEAESMWQELESAISLSPEQFKDAAKKYSADQWVKCGELVLQKMEKDKLRFLKLLAAADISGVRDGSPSLSDFYFNSAFRHGYFKALLDVHNWWEDHSDNIKYFHLSSHEAVQIILRKIIDARKQLMREGNANIFISPKELKHPSKKMLRSRKNDETTAEGKETVL